MAVVRGVQPRMSEINFYAKFSSLNIRFIGDKATGWVIEEKIPANVEFVNLPLKPRWLIDPITLTTGSRNAHRSWQDIYGLEQYLEDVDIINISDCFYFYCGQCAYLADKLDKKLITIVWESVPHHPSTYIPPYSFNVRNVLRQSDLFIARSKIAAKYLQSVGVEDGRIEVIYKGIDMKEFHPSKNKPEIPIRILYAGQLVKSKGIYELIDAFIKLLREFPHLELWICARSRGEPLEKKIKKLAKIYPIKWMGQVSYDMLPQVYRQCHIYCQLSRDWYYLGLLRGGNEWFSYSIIEAMASGLPIIATNVGGLPEQIGSDNLIVEQKNIKAVYDALKSLVLHPDKRREIGRKNIIRANKMFNINKQAKKTEQAILDKLGY